MEWWQSLILGLVEGLTEYLPVSSTGHLILAERILGIAQSDSADAFTICIQAGAILAVLGLYFGRVRQMANGMLGRDAAGLKLVVCLAAAFVPAVVAGLTLEKPIKTYLFGGDRWGLWPTIVAWIAGGIVILFVAAHRRRHGELGQKGTDLSQLTWKMGIVIGLFQCIALWPGTSRSLVTILGGLFVGLSMSAAVEFSFLLGVLTLSAATAYDALKHGREMLELYGPVTLLIGLVAAWISAVLAVKWMVGYLNRYGLELFGYYRLVLGIGVAAAVLCGWFPVAASGN